MLAGSAAVRRPGRGGIHCGPVPTKKLKDWARSLLRELRVLRIALNDDRTPWYARWLLRLLVVYLVSPIDLIPDFIPVVGYLDELLLVPIAIWIAIRLVPREVLDECRARAAAGAS